MKVKKTIKKIVALSGTALLAGMTVCSAAWAATLADLPSPIVNADGEMDSNVIVGSQTWNDLVAGDPAGVASDLASAIDVAAAFAQKATAVSGAEGTVTLEKETTPGQLKNSTGLDLGISSIDKADNTFNSSVSGFDWLTNITYTYNDTEYNVYEAIIVDGERINDEGELSIDDDLDYKATINVSTWGVPEGFDKWPLFGEEYEIIELSTNEAIFGQLTEVKKIENGESVDIGDSGTTLTYNGVNAAGDKAYVTIVDGEGVTVVDDQSYAMNKEFNNLSENGWYLKLTGLRGLDATLDMKWSTSNLKVNDSIESLEESFPDMDWTDVSVDVSTVAGLGTKRNLTSITISSPDDLVLNAGEQEELFNFFNISFDGWKNENYTTIDINEEFSGDGNEEISYTNKDGETVKINLDPFISTDSYDEIWDTTEDDAEEANISKTDSVFSNADSDYQLQYNDSQGQTFFILDDDEKIVRELTPTLINTTAYDWPRGYTVFNMTGGWWNISFTNKTANVTLINWSSSDLMEEITLEFPKASLNVSSEMSASDAVNTQNASVTLIENGGGTVDVFYNDTVINDDLFDKNTRELAVHYGDKNLEDGETRYTNWGTKVDRDGDVELTYPEEYLTADAWVGRQATADYTFEVGDDVTDTDYTVKTVGAGGAPEINEINPGIGTVDTDVTGSSLSKPAILVGGHMVNKLVSDLGEDMVPAEDLTMDRAYIQMVEDAYGSGETVLVIAGYEAKDTKLACQAFAAHLLGHMTLDLTGNLTWLDTSGATYSEIAVV